MKAKSIYKIPNGKLLKINLDFDEKLKKINKLNITGDFFAYPEESIEHIENELINSDIDINIINKKIEKIIIAHNIHFIGIDSEGITKAIMMCLK